MREPTLIDDEVADEVAAMIDDEAMDESNLPDITVASVPMAIDEDRAEESDSAPQVNLEEDEEGDETILARLRHDSAEPQIRPNLVPGAGAAAKTATRERVAREMKISQHGIPYPSLPPATIKRLASSYLRQSGSNGKINKETLQAISSATDWFFEQVSQDLGAYAQHAGRKRIEEADVVTLMKRQRIVGEKDTVFSLAQKILPRELLQEVRMPPPVIKGRLGKRKRLETIAEEEEG